MYDMPKLIKLCVVGISTNLEFPLINTLQKLTPYKSIVAADDHDRIWKRVSKDKRMLETLVQHLLNSDSKRQEFINRITADKDRFYQLILPIMKKDDVFLD